MTRPSNQSYERKLQDAIKPLQNILNPKIIESITQIAKEPKSFEEFEKSVTYYGDLINEDGLIDGENSRFEENLIHLVNLKNLAKQVSYSKRIDFMKSILKQKNSKNILFSSCFTEERINKRYKKIAIHFHPDKNIKLNIHKDLQEEYKNLCNELFKYTSALRKSLLLNLGALSKMSPIVFHQEKGNEFWKIAIDYRNAHKAEWSKLKHLIKENLIEVPPEILIDESIYNAELAYQEYRQACKLADQEKQLKSQIELRGYMALSLYISNQFLEAQLYALSAMRLMYRYRNQMTFTIQEVNHAKSIFYKVKGGDPGEKSDQLKNEINVELEKIVNELMIKVNRSLVCWQANRDEILMAKNSAKGSTEKGLAIFSQTVVLGSQAATAGYAVGSVLLGASTGIGIIGLGLYYGYGIHKKGTQLSEELKTREALNEIMKNALHAYDKGEYQLFFNELSKNYNSKNRLLKLESCKDFIKTEDIVNELLLHGFRPDGIAYLLNLIGEVLNSGKIKVKGMVLRELKALGAKVWLELVENKKLIDEAKKLDDRLKNLRENTYKAHMNKLSKLNDFIQDEQEKPFVTRLDENRYTAMINLAIRDTLNGDSEDIERAKKTIKEVQQLINMHHQYFGKTQTRLEMLEDLLWVLCAEESTQTYFDSRLRLTDI